ncbi:LacI family DNA-binding transcriptional regulator [Streptomyces sp. NEAU-H3]|uniref:LacI family DNA-binding transcriptional regulator n=1 Tax=Streptomyces sp. NEAU-H3 TaxID=2720636 RepID=UPI00143BAB1B|nr:LacI family DNA-binding transcriptional regulator [Streptomyces sp. NEAU-H3]NJA58001.1 substrate-binding domain-containing protein [Streptomyces sp. NEAU-H3]
MTRVKRGAGRPTLEEVASRAGVGRGTVSRVINGSPKVSPRTRAAVEAAVLELGYVPNTAARALAANRADAIALVVPEPQTRFFAEPYFSDIVLGIGSALADTPLQLLLTFAGGERERGRLAGYLDAHRVDGVLLVAVHADDPLPDRLAELGMPAVISGPRSAAETLPSVDSDNYGGAVAAVRHLQSRGRRRIAHITGRLEVYGAERRLAGYRASILLDRAPGLDAVFAASDLLASGARHTLRAAGRRIPEDVALIGFDDSAIARHLDPPLTSVSQPTAEMGRVMTRMLLDEIAARAAGAGTPPGTAGRQTVLATRLVVRESS